jgi:hypothetical protein
MAQVFANVFLPTEMAELLSDPIVQAKKGETVLKKGITVNTKFTLANKPAILDKVNQVFGLNLSGDLPMRWIKGDTPPHVDQKIADATKSEGGTVVDDDDDDKNTYLIYITVPEKAHLVIDRKLYSLKAGTAYQFNKDLLHGTTSPHFLKNDNLKLLIGPMNSKGEPVGIVSIESLSISPGAFVEPYSIVEPYFYGPLVSTLFTNVSSCTITGVAIDGFYLKINGITTNSFTVQLPLGLNQATIVSVTSYNSSNDSPGNSCEITINSSRQINRPTTINYQHRSLFTDNSMVFYKPHSFAASGAGSGVRNSRAVSRRT